jgi:hypothetical protein
MGYCSCEQFLSRSITHWPWKMALCEGARRDGPDYCEIRFAPAISSIYPVAWIVMDLGYSCIFEMRHMG